MKYYLIDDDELIIRILENIIEEECLGEIIGFNSSSKVALEEIPFLSPDVILIDLLMPDMDGINLVKEIKKRSVKSKIVMISQVDEKTLISKAYESGIDFYIHKPINKIELKKVLDNINKISEYENKFEIMKGVFNSEFNKTLNAPSLIKTRVDNITFIFSKLGIVGEKGAKDLLQICEYLIKEKKTTYDLNLQEICKDLTKNPRAMEQRIRRTINKSLLNIASIGLEDYLNDVYTRYSNTLFDFENVKAEMDYLRGKKETGGKINVKKFIDNIIIFSEY
ncbi:response regulator [Helicovermis profundi]|uniref:Stage 0 sporulation protein A homolog n=1 Tax=Helicovermis profundi TaxID=3065157 RepID=A0AAU9EP74_9FIRM|nr:response regulator [Clostridia bacterium S502]